jgi:hypothetical protein
VTLADSIRERRRRRPRHTDHSWDDIDAQAKAKSAHRVAGRVRLRRVSCVLRASPAWWRGRRPRPKIERPGNGTLAALITSYKQDSGFCDLRETTKAGYLSRLDAIRREHGERSVAGLNPERIETMLAAYNDRPAAKLDTLKKLRILIEHALKKKWIGADPAAGIKRANIGEDH